MNGATEPEILQALDAAISAWMSTHEGHVALGPGVDPVAPWDVDRR